jgi:hypothetical protein
MVKSERYTCDICDKMYSSASSIWNHRTKLHKNENNSIQQHNNSIEQHITALESVDFNCRYCDKSYKHQQSRSRHEIICKKIKLEIIEKNKLEIIEKNNSQIIEKNNSQIIENQNNIQNNGTMNTNNGTINNNTTNNITINNFGQENLDYLTDTLMKKILTRLTKHDDDSVKNAIPILAKIIHFNPNHKENNNVEINSVKSKTAKKMIDGKMKYVIKERLIKDIHAKLIELLQDYINTHKSEITRAMAKCLDHYKLKNPEYIKKVIHEEINLLGYVFYKNNIDKDELDS